MLETRRSADEVFHTVATDDNTSYILDHDLRLVRTNPAWARFARANDGERVLVEWGPGRSIVEAICDELRPFYVNGFAHAHETGRTWEHDYECSSAGMFRTFRMIAFPIGDGFVVTHALRIVRFHDRPVFPPSDVYSARGVITMCAHCRRVRHTQVPDRWDWVPAYVAEPPFNTTHGLCPPCKQYYYGQAAPEARPH